MKGVGEMKTEGDAREEGVVGWAGRVQSVTEVSETKDAWRVLCSRVTPKPL